MTRLALLIAALCVAACGPTLLLPGGKLDGEVVSAPVDDWSFTRDTKTIQLETNPADPYSVNLWCVAKGPSLWISAGRESNTWAKNLLADSRARVRVGERLYERQAVRVTDPAEVELVRSLYQEKYEREPDSSSALQFRLDPR